jgi:putative ABC transport system ATP-binding protein
MIEVIDLCKTFTSGRGNVTALEHLSFEVGMGAFFVVAGKSGSGKTTLLNCIGGLEKPDRGSIRCDGADIGALSRKSLARFQRQRLGFLFQQGNLLSYLTVGENLALPLALNGIGGRRRKARIDELLGAIGLPDLGPALPRELSGGETQRVAFARAIAHGPKLLLADEPTASLDSATGRHLIQTMAALSRSQQCTLLVASHDPEVICAADHRLALKDGRKEDSREV